MTETVPIQTLILDPSNARKHSKKNLDSIKGSLARFGQQKPIVISKDNIVIAGNGTLEAAKALGWKDIQVNRSELTGVEATAYAIADNRTGELAEWDGDVLGKTLQSLKAENFDLDAIGFSDEDLKQWVKEAEVIPGCGEDDVPNAEEVETRCKLGDLWILDGHRLLCGDSTDMLAVERLMSDGPVYTWYADSHGKQLYNAIDAVGQYHAMIVWHKINAKYGALYAHYKQRHEPCVYWKPKGSTLRWDGPSNECNIWEIKRDARNELHPTQKPVELAERAISNHTAKSILDLFLGSGSTLIACEKTKRKCYGMEIDPMYCDVILARWEKFTGKTAQLEIKI